MPTNSGCTRTTTTLLSWHWAASRHSNSICADKVSFSLEKLLGDHFRWYARQLNCWMEQRRIHRSTEALRTCNSGSSLTIFTADLSGAGGESEENLWLFSENVQTLPPTKQSRKWTQLSADSNAQAVVAAYRYWVGGNRVSSGLLH